MHPRGAGEALGGSQRNTASQDGRDLEGDWLLEVVKGGPGGRPLDTETQLKTRAKRDATGWRKERRKKEAREVMSPAVHQINWEMR